VSKYEIKLSEFQWEENKPDKLWGITCNSSSAHFKTQFQIL